MLLGILLSMIVLIPIFMARPYIIEENTSIYTEDAILYNALYLQYINEPGGAVSDDFVMLNYYNIQAGISLTFSLMITQGSASLYYIVVFLKDALGNYTIKRSENLPSNEWSYSMRIDTFGVYGFVVFGHRETSAMSIRTGVLVIAQ